jgi:gas vesicle protein
MSTSVQQSITKKHIMKNYGNIFIGIIAAATAGVVIGMLIAPEKGKDLQKNIKRSAGNWPRKMSDLMAEGKEHFEGLKSIFGEGSRELKNEVRDLKNGVSDAYKNA